MAIHTIPPKSLHKNKEILYIKNKAFWPFFVPSKASQFLMPTSITQKSETNCQFGIKEKGSNICFTLSMKFFSVTDAIVACSTQTLAKPEYKSNRS